MRRLSVFLACCASIITVPVVAQETEEPFTGGYVSGQIGYELQSNDIGSSIEFDRNNDGVFGDTVLTSTGANAFSPGFCNGKAQRVTNDFCENDRSRVSYYGRVGFDKQMGNLVVGAFGSFGKPGITDYVSAFSTTPANYVFVRKINWEASAQARAGFAVKNTLFYLTGGLGYANVDHRFTTSNTANAFALSGDEREFGFIGGGGLEQKIGENISIGVEYSYHQYKDNEFTVRTTQGTAGPTNPFILPPDTSGTTFRRSDDQFRWHSLRAGVTFRF